MSLEENKALVRRFVEEVQCQHNLAALDELFSPDFVDHSGMTNPPTLEGSRQFFSMMFAAFPDMRFIIRQQIAEGDKVLTHKTLHGHAAWPLHGHPGHRQGSRRRRHGHLHRRCRQDHRALDRRRHARHDAAARRHPGP